MLKIAQNMKFDWLVFAQHGIEVAPVEDTMLLSYVLDAGRNDHGMDVLAKNTSATSRSSSARSPGSGRASSASRASPIDKATEYSAEDADVTLRLWRVLKPRLAAEHMTRGL